MGTHRRWTGAGTVARRAGLPLMIAAGFLVPFAGSSLAEAAPVLPGPDAAAPAPAPAPPASSPSGPAAGSPAPAAQGAPAPQAAPAPHAPAGESPTASSPCAPAVKACARLSTNEMWVTDGRGTVLRGPIRMTHGAKGEETPVGSFRVTAKDATHVSQEQAGTKMPWSVFFDDHGRAFHGGSLARQSAGCVHLSDDDAKFVFDHLAVGDQVQILG